MTTYRWLVASDIHGSVELWERLLIESRSIEGVSAVILCGDLTNYGKRISLLNSNRATYAEFLAAQAFVKRIALQKPVYWIAGNHDLDIVESDFDFPNVVYCDKKTILIDGFSVRGVNQSPCFAIPEMADEWRNMSALPKVDAAAYDFEKVDIVVSHCPPLGMLDKIGGNEIGSPGLKEYIRLNKPEFVFCGHVHEDGGKVMKVGRTTVANVARTTRIFSLLHR